MNEVEKEVREILKGIAGRVYCKYCDGYDFECGCSIDVNERNVAQATTEIMGIINKIKAPLRNGVSPELWCKTYDENNLLRSDLVEKEKENRSLKNDVNNWREVARCKKAEDIREIGKKIESIEKEAVTEIRELKEETKRLRKELEQSLKGEE